MAAVGMIAQAEGGKQGGDRRSDSFKSDIVTLEKDTPERGNSVSYTMRRLAKSAPAIHEKVIAGELSPNQAAIEAEALIGIAAERAKERQVRKPSDFVGEPVHTQSSGGRAADEVGAQLGVSDRTVSDLLTVKEGGTNS